MDTDKRDQALYLVFIQGSAFIYIYTCAVLRGTMWRAAQVFVVEKGFSNSQRGLLLHNKPRCVKRIYQNQAIL